METIKFGIGKTLIEVRGDTGEILLSKTEERVPLGPMLMDEAPPCEDVALLHFPTVHSLNYFISNLKELRDLMLAHEHERFLKSLEVRATVVKDSNTCLICHQDMEDEGCCMEQVK